jgi:hypothetical protein
MRRFLLLGLLICPTPAMAHDEPSVAPAELDRAFAELEQAADQIRTRSETDPAVALPDEIRALDGNIDRLRQSAGSIASQDVEEYSQALEAQAETLRQGAQAEDLNSARFRISSGAHNLDLMGRTMANGGSAAPRLLTTVKVNVFALAGVSRVPGYLIAAHPFADPDSTVAIGVSKTDGPASAHLSPGSYHFIAVRGDRRVVTPVPVDVGGYGRFAQDVEVVVD